MRIRTFSAARSRSKLAARITFGFAGIVACLFALPTAQVFAGGQGESQGASAASGSSAPVTVKLWDIQTQDDQQMIQTATEKFNKDHPNIHVVPEWFQNDPYKNKIRIALGAGNGPDNLFN